MVEKETAERVDIVLYIQIQDSMWSLGITMKVNQSDLVQWFRAKKVKCKSVF